MCCFCFVGVVLFFFSFLTYFTGFDADEPDLNENQDFLLALACSGTGCGCFLLLLLLLLLDLEEDDFDLELEDDLVVFAGAAGGPQPQSGGSNTAKNFPLGERFIG